MATGQVGFKDNKKVGCSPALQWDSYVAELGKQVKKIFVAQRENAIVNRLNKTKVEKQPNLKQEKDDRLRELRLREQAAQQQRVGFLLGCLHTSKMHAYLYIPTAQGGG